jgi:hypothetical protein
MATKQKTEQTETTFDLKVYYESQIERWQKKAERRIHAPKVKQAERRVKHYQKKLADLG